MEKPLKREIVVISFPFSSLTNSKKRPALIIAQAEGDDLIMLQITTKQTRHSIPLTNKDFEHGALSQDSLIRPDKIFTIEQQKVLYKIGKIKKQKMDEVEESLFNLIKNSL